MKYNPALDGLRAIAILGVLVFHVFPELLPGGFTGVDVFFVLSGFLITSVILGDLRHGDFSLREFYLRRVQRLLPNCALMILATVVLVRYFVLPSGALGVAKHGLWALGNVSNIYVWRTSSGYWGESAARMPLLHTWSLAVEEQFYLLFPLFVLCIARFAKSQLMRTIVYLTVLDFVYHLGEILWNLGGNEASTFYLLRNRAWEPLLGAALAAYRTPLAADQPLRSVPASRTIKRLSRLGLLAIVVGFYAIRPGQSFYDTFPGFLALIPAGATLLTLVSIADGSSRAARLLSHPLLVGIGKASYSLYLWHWPFIVLGKTYAELTGRSERLCEIIGAAIGIVVGCAAYRFVEQPLRQRGPGRVRRLSFVGAGYALSVVVCLVAFRPPPPAPYAFDKPIMSGRPYDLIRSDIAKIPTTAAQFADVEWTAPDEPIPPEPWESGGIIHRWGGDVPRVVVTGSSHACMFGRTIDEICRELKLSVAFFSGDGHMVANNEGYQERALYAARLRWVREWQPDVLIAIDRWDLYPPAEFAQQITGVVTELEPHTRQILFFSQVPVLSIGESINLREFASKRLHDDGKLPTIHPDAKEDVRRAAHHVLQGLASANPKVRLLRVDEAFYLPDGSVKFAAERSFFYGDDDHLTQAGTDQVRDVCLRVLVDAVGGPSGLPGRSRATARVSAADR